MSDRLEAKIDKILEKLEEQGKILVRHEVLHQKNTEDLAEHIRRTQLAEAAILKNEEAVNTRIMPIEKHVHVVGVLLKITMFIVPIAVTIYFKLKGIP